MSLTEWDNRYELGIHELDEHHQKLVELMNNTYKSVLYSTDNDEIQTILTELTEYTNYHFDTEERMMKEAGYTGLPTHAAHHSTFKKQLTVLMQNHRSGTPHVNTDIVLFLWDWLQKHILKDDKQLTAYVCAPHPSLI